MDDIVTGVVIGGLTMAVLGSLITALLHGLGFLVFGYKEIRPSYSKRWLMSFLAFILLTLVFYLIGDHITNLFAGNMTPDNMMGMMIFYGLVFIAIDHLTLSTITYFVFNAKGNLGAALKTPFLITGLLIAVFIVIPSIVLGSKM